jgi:hypothetical protein
LDLFVKVKVRTSFFDSTAHVRLICNGMSAGNVGARSADASTPFVVGNGTIGWRVDAVE